MLSIHQILFLVIAILPLTLAGVHFIFICQWQQAGDSTDLVYYTEKLFQHIQKVILSALDSGTKARRYVSTGKDKFLKCIGAKNAAAFIYLPGNKYDQ